MPKTISHHRLSDAAHAYFGDDVQRYWLERVQPGVYQIVQLTHRSGTRIGALVFAGNARTAAKLLNKVAAHKIAEAEPGTYR